MAREPHSEHEHNHKLADSGDGWILVVLLCDLTSVYDLQITVQMLQSFYYLE